MHWWAPPTNEPVELDVLVSLDRVTKRWRARACSTDGLSLARLSPAQQDMTVKAVLQGLGAPLHHAGKLFTRYAGRVSVKRHEIPHDGSMRRPFVGFEIRLVRRFEDANEIAKKFAGLTCNFRHNLSDGTEVSCVRDIDHHGACGFEHVLDPKSTDTYVRDGGLEVLGKCLRCGRDAADPLGLIGGEFSPCRGDGRALFKPTETTATPGFVFVLWPHLTADGVSVVLNGREISYGELATEGDWWVDDQGVMRLWAGAQTGDRLEIRTGVTLQGLKLFATKPGDPVRFKYRNISFGSAPDPSTICYERGPLGGKCERTKGHEGEHREGDFERWPKDPAIASPRWNDDYEGI